MTTTFLEGSATRTWGGHQAARCSDELFGRYQQILEASNLTVAEFEEDVRREINQRFGAQHVRFERGRNLHDECCLLWTTWIVVTLSKC